MKIYFDGCSWTFGAELVDHKESRFSKLICDNLRAEEYNFAVVGGSNDRILRNVIVENDIEQYDLAIIQLTFTPRTEFYNSKLKEWTRIVEYIDYSGHWLNDNFIKKFISNSNYKFIKTKEDKDFWTYYYTDICSDVFLKTKEKIIYESIKSFFAYKKVPLILVTIDSRSKLKFDLNMGQKYYPLAPGRHPNEDGHKMIANDILNINTSRKML